MAEWEMLSVEWEIHRGHHDSVQTKCLVSNNRYTMKSGKELTQIKD